MAECAGALPAYTSPSTEADCVTRLQIHNYMIYIAVMLTDWEFGYRGQGSDGSGFARKRQVCVASPARLEQQAAEMPYFHRLAGEPLCGDFCVKTGSKPPCQGV